MIFKKEFIKKFNDIKESIINDIKTKNLKKLKKYTHMLEQ